MALDLIRTPTATCVGVIALEMETGEVMIFEARSRCFATGGAGRIFDASTNAYINTGDGLGLSPARAFRSRTWSSGSSTRPAWPGPAC
jgi:succinate dehydrogenase / fumarate reductase, flavoprotein subunit